MPTLEDFRLSNRRNRTSGLDWSWFGEVAVLFADVVAPEIGAQEVVRLPGQPLRSHLSPRLPFQIYHACAVHSLGPKLS